MHTEPALLPRDPFSYYLSISSRHIQILHSPIVNIVVCPSSTLQ